MVNSLDWKAATRVFFHIGDAPCHGRQYHDMADDHAGGDPNRLEANSLLHAMKDMNVQYFFGKINNSTDKMIRMFQDCVGDDFIHTIHVADAAKMMDMITTTVKESMYTTISKSMDTDATSGADLELAKDVVLDIRTPAWHSLRKEQVHIFDMALPASIEELISTEPDKFVQPIPRLQDVKVALYPFDKGSVQLAYKAIMVKQPDVTIVHKMALSHNSKDAIRTKYEERYLSNHTVSYFLAREYMKVRPPDMAGIEYCEISLVNYLERPGAPYCTQEILLRGSYDKYNNNSGSVMPNPSKSGVDHPCCPSLLSLDLPHY